MANNKLSLNPDKSQVMLWTEDDRERQDFQIILEGNTIRHQKEIKILGNTISDSLTWDSHIAKNLIPSLRNRVQTLKIVSRYMDKGFKARFANSIFRSKLMFSLETWGGGPKTLITRIQSLQNQASKWALPRKLREKMTRQRLKILNWLSIKDEILRATHLQTFKVLNLQSPRELHEMMPMNVTAPRMNTGN